MRLDALEAFIHVAENSSFTRTAEELDLSQPTVTNRVAALEADLSTRLFDRVGRCAHLTEAGRLLLPSAYRINALLTIAHSNIAPKERTAKGSLIIGISEYVEQDRVASILKTYRDCCPNIDLKLHPSSAEDILHKIDLGLFDIGLCSTTPHHVSEDHGNHLSSIEIWSEALKVVVEQGHNLAESSDVSFEELCDYPSVLPIHPAGLRKALERELMKYVETIDPIDVSAMHKIQSLVSNGIGWSVLPEHAVRDPLIALHIDDFELTHSVRLFQNSSIAASHAREVFVELAATPVSIESTQPQSEETFDDPQTTVALENVA